jgi:predicted enzyme related to lactoylglutathione lyase
MQSPKLDWVLLYVADTMKSAVFYERLLGLQPAQAPTTPTEFTMFPQPGGFTLGLWHKDEIDPKATPPGGCEISITEKTAAAVRERHAAWVADGITILQKPTTLDFGTTFTAVDPDGHRIRVFAEAAR